MSAGINDYSLKSLFRRLDRTAKISILVVVIAIIFPFFAAGRKNAPVKLPGNVRYETAFYADGHMESSPSGKSITLYPYHNVFSTTYEIRYGNELWTEYGQVAKIREKPNGTIRIYNCSTNHVYDAIGGTWKPSK